MLSQQPQDRIMTKRFKVVFCVFASALIGIGSGPSARAQTEPLQNVSGTSDVLTSNCSGGACQANGDNGGAGPNPVNITATVSLCQANGVLRGVGIGRGFQPGKTYISLLYKNGNVTTCSRFPEGVDASLANASNPQSGVDNDFASMMLGIWQVRPDGSATLIVMKDAPVPGLQNYKTVSVREMQLTQPASPLFKPDRDPAPQLNALRACGSLETRTNRLEAGDYPCSVTEVCSSLCANNQAVCDVISQMSDPTGNKPNLCDPLAPPPREVEPQ